VVLACGSGLWFWPVVLAGGSGRWFSGWSALAGGMMTGKKKCRRIDIHPAFLFCWAA
jgi:hypothetical protein